MVTMNPCSKTTELRPMKLEILESAMTTAIPREIVSRVRGQVGKKKQIMGPFWRFSDFFTTRFMVSNLETTWSFMRIRWKLLETWYPKNLSLLTKKCMSLGNAYLQRLKVSSTPALNWFTNIKLIKQDLIMVKYQCHELAVWFYTQLTKTCQN